MPKVARELSPIEVRRLTRPGFHGVGGATGLYLQVTESGARSWVLRIKIGDKRRDMGLGSFVDVPLARAREKAREKREEIRRGGRPHRGEARGQGRPTGCSGEDCHVR